MSLLKVKGSRKGVQGVCAMGLANGWFSYLFFGVRARTADAF